jgi:hypothetical protein
MDDRPRGGGIPPGLGLRQTLRGHREPILTLAWSPDGKRLASGSEDRTIRLWNAAGGPAHRTLERHADWVSRVAWSPDGRMLASGSSDGTIQLWDAQMGEVLRVLAGHTGWITGLAWSPDGQTLASGSSDGTIQLWDSRGWELRRTLQGHTGLVLSLAWSPDGQMLASGSGSGVILLWDGHSREPSRMLEGHTAAVRSLAWSSDGRTLASGADSGTIRLWDYLPGRPTNILEGHTGPINGLQFSPDGALLASKADDVRLWQGDPWEPVAILPEPRTSRWSSALAFHPSAPLLATLGEDGRTIAVWDLDVSTLLRSPPPSTSSHYASAKVVVVGAAGVGKTGLASVLAGRAFQETGATLGRRIWTIESREVARGDGRRETRETRLWDLAGRPDYRLVHPWNLRQVAVALLVYDPTNPTDPFSGVRHWDRALRQAQWLQGEGTPPLKKFLVAARVDRPGSGIDAAQVEALAADLGCDGSFQTSARDGTGLTELAEAIRGAIDWSRIPSVTSTDLFRKIQAFLVAEKETGWPLASAHDLFAAFLASGAEEGGGDELSDQFTTCVALIEGRGLIRRLSVGDLILLQTEWLDAYAAALIRAATDDPDGLGGLAEDDVRAGRLPIPPEDQFAGREHEELLRIATVEDLLQHEIALREEAAGRSRLVFPSQVTRELADGPAPAGRAVTFLFEGPVSLDYAALVVRLSRADACARTALGRDAAIFTVPGGGSCTIQVREVEEALGELTLTFDAGAGPATRSLFEAFVHAHLLRRSLPDRIRRLPTCPRCRVVLPDSLAQSQGDLSRATLQCPGCGWETALPGPQAAADAPAAAVAEMDRVADARRQSAVVASLHDARAAIGECDVFLCCNRDDRTAARAIGDRLRAAGILPWPGAKGTAGRSSHEELEAALAKVKAAVIFLGPNGIGREQKAEIAALLNAAASRGLSITPVILAETSRHARPPAFLGNWEWIDFRQKEQDPFAKLVTRLTAAPKAPSG